MHYSFSLCIEVCLFFMVVCLSFGHQIFLVKIVNHYQIPEILHSLLFPSQAPYRCSFVDPFKRLYRRVVHSCTRIQVNLEVISEVTIAVVTGGPGAILWMVGMLFLLAITDIASIKKQRSAQNQRETASLFSLPTKRPFIFPVYYLSILILTIYNSIIFQTNQVVASFGITKVTCQTPVLLITVIGIILLIVVSAMLKYRRLTYLMHLLALAASLLFVFLSAQTILLHVQNLRCVIKSIVLSSCHLKAATCGIVSACSIGAYSIHIKRSRNEAAPLKTSSLSHIFFEYLVTAILCCVTGLSVVVTGAHHAINHSFREESFIFLQALESVKYCPLSASMVVVFLAFFIICTESYYGYHHCTKIFHPQNQTSFMRKVMLLYCTSFAIFILLKALKINITPFICVSDHLSALVAIISIFLALSSSNKRDLIAASSSRK